MNILDLIKVERILFMARRFIAITARYEAAESSLLEALPHIVIRTSLVMLAQANHPRVDPLATIHMLDGSFAHKKVHVIAHFDRGHKHGIIQPVRIELVSSELARGPQIAVDQVVRSQTLLRVVDASGKIVVAIFETQIGQTGVGTIWTLPDAIKRVESQR